jgi:hypothetical protein
MLEHGAALTLVNILWRRKGRSKATTHKKKGIKITRRPNCNSEELLVLWIPQYYVMLKLVRKKFFLTIHKTSVSLLQKTHPICITTAGD